MAQLNMVVFLLLVGVIGLAHCGQRIDLILSGRDIPSNDLVWGETEPYVKVFYKFTPTNNYISYGQTSVSENNPNPNWPQVFTFDYIGGMDQIAKFELWDQDAIWDDKIGEIEIPMGSIVNGADGAGHFERAFSPSGRGNLVLKVRIDGVIG